MHSIGNKIAYNSHWSAKYSLLVRTSPVDVYIRTFNLDCICKQTLVSVYNCKATSDSHTYCMFAPHKHTRWHSMQTPIYTQVKALIYIHTSQTFIHTRTHMRTHAHTDTHMFKYTSTCTHM